MSDNHERISELLPAYLSDELGPRERAEVAAHLDGCDECRREEDALRALVVGPDERLTELERTRLRRDVMAAIEEPVVAERQGLSARVVPYLGVAALLALLLFGATRLDLGGGNDMESAEGGGSGDAGGAPEAETAEEAPGSDRVRNSRADDPEALSDQGVASGAATEGTSSDDAGSRSGALYVAPPERYTRSGLRTLASHEDPFITFARTYTVADTSRRDGFLESLAEAAEGEKAELIRACGASVLDDQQEILPAYAGFGTLEGEGVLVLGFVLSDDDSGPLDRYQIWAWPRGDCDAVPKLYLLGRIRT